MTDPSRLFSDLMDSMTKAQGEAWQYQAQLMRKAGEAFSEAARGSEAPKPETGDASPFDEAWAVSRDIFEKWKEYANAAMPAGQEGGFGAEMLDHIMDPGAWLNIGVNELNQTVENLAEGIQFANLWRTERRMLEASREWVNLREQSLRYRQIIIAAWMRAFERFSATVGKDLGDEDKTPPDWRTLMNSWLEIANDELLRTQLSDDFLSAQRDLLRASIDFRARQHEFIEEFCEANAMPTRTEVDDLHRTVTELQREMRALRRELEARKTAPRPASKPRKAAKKAARRTVRAPGTKTEPKA